MHAQVISRSTVKTKSLAPEWNELWRVKNVPTTSELRVEILDKDTDTPHDDYIGKFKTSIEAGEKEIDIQGPLFRKDRGTFKLKVCYSYSYVLSYSVANILTFIRLKQHPLPIPLNPNIFSMVPFATRAIFHR